MSSGAESTRGTDFASHKKWRKLFEIEARRTYVHQIIGGNVAQLNEGLWLRIRGPGSLVQEAVHLNVKFMYVYANAPPSAVVRNNKYEHT